MLVLRNFLRNFREGQILWSLCLVVFLALTLKLLIQTSLSVAPELPVSLRSGENVKIPENKHTPGFFAGVGGENPPRMTIVLTLANLSRNSRYY